MSTFDQQPCSQPSGLLRSIGSDTLLDMDVEAMLSEGEFFVSKSTWIRTLSPFSGSSARSQSLQMKSASTTSVFDEGFRGPEPSVDSTMPDIDPDQAETKLFEGLRSTRSSLASKPAEPPKTRATKKNKGNAKTSIRGGITPDKAVSVENAPHAVASISKPRKRGRPKNNNTEADLEEYPQEELAEDGFPKDPHRRRVLERNRIAATKCRNRKRNEARGLMLQEQKAENQNRYLSSVCGSLNAQIYDLKTQLLRHSDCSCELIQTYLAHEAKRLVDTRMGMPTSTRGSDYPASAVASSSGSIKTSFEAEETSSWTNPLPIIQAVTTPANAGCSFESFPVESVPPGRSLPPQPAELPVSAFDMSASGLIVPPGHPTTPIIHALPEDCGFWNPWEMQ